MTYLGVDHCTLRGLILRSRCGGSNSRSTDSRPETSAVKGSRARRDVPAVGTAVGLPRGMGPGPALTLGAAADSVQAAAPFGGEGAQSRQPKRRAGPGIPGCLFGSNPKPD